MFSIDGNNNNKLPSGIFSYLLPLPLRTVQLAERGMPVRAIERDVTASGKRRSRVAAVSAGLYLNAVVVL